MDMLTIPRDHSTIDRLQALLNEMFRARDELYAAAESLADADESYICRRLADRLGGQAADLQQIIIASGFRPVEPRSQGDVEAMRASIRSQPSDRGILEIVGQVEQLLTEQYDLAIEHLDDLEVADLLSKQREEAEFADCVVRRLKDTP